jgi:hypothetical protein
MIVPSLFTGAALIGVATAMWSRLKMLLNRIWSVFFVTVHLNGNVVNAVKIYAWKNCRRSPFGTRKYSGKFVWIRPVRKMQNVCYEVLPDDPILFWKGKIPLLLGTLQTKNSPTSVDAEESDKVTLTFIRGTIDLDQLLIDATQNMNDTISNANGERTNRFYIHKFVGSGANNRGSNGKNEQLQYGGMGKASPTRAPLSSGEYRLLKWKLDDIGADTTDAVSALGALALDASALEAVNELKHWLSSEKWYRERQIPWTRGWVLWGKPGSGKSSFVRACGEDLGLPIYIFDLSSMSNAEFQRFFSQALENTPCIAVFEDIDAVFNKRENTTGLEGGLTFDCFLNALSGIEGTHGMLKVITTNRIDYLDEALGVPRLDTSGTSMSTRPGRADRAIEMQELDAVGRLKIAKRILSDCLQYVETICQQGDKDTGAQFVERCARLALAEFWRKKETIVKKDPPLAEQVKLPSHYSLGGVKNF